MLHVSCYAQTTTCKLAEPKKLSRQWIMLTRKTGMNKWRERERERERERDTPYVFMTTKCDSINFH